MALGDVAGARFGARCGSFAVVFVGCGAGRPASVRALGVTVSRRHGVTAFRRFGVSAFRVRGTRARRVRGTRGEETWAGEGPTDGGSLRRGPSQGTCSPPHLSRTPRHCHRPARVMPAVDGASAREPWAPPLLPSLVGPQPRTQIVGAPLFGARGTSRAGSWRLSARAVLADRSSRLEADALFVGTRVGCPCGQVIMAPAEALFVR